MVAHYSGTDHRSSDGVTDLSIVRDMRERGSYKKDTTPAGTTEGKAKKHQDKILPSRVPQLALHHLPIT